MSIGGRIFARTYNGMMRRTEKAGLRVMRGTILADLDGDVLEIGAGTGLNLGHYGPAINSLTLAEPDPSMVRRLEMVVAASTVKATVLRAPAEDLPFPDASFDVVVSTLVLCTVDDAPRAMREVRRVLRPGGRFVFVEHVRADDPKLARKQDRMNGLTRIVAHGCNCNRPTLDVINATGFSAVDVDHGELPKAPPFMRPLIVGTTVVPSVARN